MAKIEDTTRHFAASSYAYSLTHDAGSAIERLARMGFPEIEIPAVPGHLWPQELDAGERRRLIRQTADADATITTLTMPSMDINLTAASPDVRRQTIAAIGELIDLAGDLGVPHVLITPGKSNPLLRPAPERLAGYFGEALEKLVPQAAARGTRVVIENVPACHPNDGPGLAALIEGCGMDVGIVYDVANAFFVGEDLGRGLEAVRNHIDVLHLSDTGLTAWRHDEIGTGGVPFAGLAALVEQIGFDRRPVLEIIAPELDAPFLRSAVAMGQLGWPLAASGR